MLERNVRNKLDNMYIDYALKIIDAQQKKYIDC